MNKKIFAVLFLLIMIVFGSLILGINQTTTTIDNTHKIIYPAYSYKTANGTNVIVLFGNNSNYLPNYSPDLSPSTSGYQQSKYPAFYINLNSTENSLNSVVAPLGAGQGGFYAYLNVVGYYLGSSFTYNFTFVILLNAITEIYAEQAGFVYNWSAQLTFTSLYSYTGAGGNIYTYNGSLTYNPSSLGYSSYSYFSTTAFNYGNGYYDPLYNVILTSSPFSNIGNKPIYTITFNYPNGDFNLFLNGITVYNAVNTYSLGLTNGSYLITFQISNNNYDTNYSLAFVVNGKSETVNLFGNSTFTQHGYLALYVYLILGGILLLAIMRISNGIFMVYTMSMWIFIFIGYKLQIPYFNTALILNILTLIVGIFTYKMVIE